MTVALVAASALIFSAPTRWFGPGEASFSLTSQGNPFDFETNDVMVDFRSASGNHEKRPAYFSHGKWHVRLAAGEPGRYVGGVTRNGKHTGVQVTVALDKEMPRGFIRRAGTGFVFDSGEPYWPIGFNFAWKSDGIPDLVDALPAMGRAGVNWTRIWSNHWDGKNPFWVKGDPLKFDEAALDRWQSIVDAAEANGVPFQFVLFHHGPWSTRVNSNWAENPLNKANGGWLENPTGFFTDPRAQKVAKAWIRYAIARYGSRTSVMAWELFNEVEWVDPIYEQREQLVGDWHKEMAAFVRLSDPYRHLVTTSSRLSLPIYASMDYYQPHGYPNRIESLLLGVVPSGAKPWFYGEVGLAQPGSTEAQRTAIRDAIFVPLVKGHSGAAQFWYWDAVFSLELLDEYAFARKVLSESGALSQKFTPFKPSIDSPAADLAISLAGDWEPMSKFDFDLPSDAAQLATISSFFQGRAHLEMRQKPLTLRFNAPAPGLATVGFLEASGGGGNLVARIGGAEVARVEFLAGTPANGKVLNIPIPAGPVTLTLVNDGPDWLRVAEIRIPGIGAVGSTYGCGNTGFALLRIQKSRGAKPFQTSIAQLPLANGIFTMTAYDLTAKTSVKRKVAVSSGKTDEKFLISVDDQVLVFNKSPN